MKCVARVSDSLVLARFGGEGGMLLQMERRELQKGEEGELTKARQEGEEGVVTKVARAPCLGSSVGLRSSDIELSSRGPSPIVVRISWLVFEVDSKKLVAKVLAVSRGRAVSRSSGVELE